MVPPAGCTPPGALSSDPQPGLQLFVECSLESKITTLIQDDHQNRNVILPRPPTEVERLFRVTVSCTDAQVGRACKVTSGVVLNVHYDPSFFRTPNDLAPPDWELPVNTAL